MSGAVGHILWLGIVQRSSPCFVNLSLCLGRPCFCSSDVFCFVRLPFFPSASWPLSFLSLFLRPCLIHARMPDWGRAFVHRHSWSWSFVHGHSWSWSFVHGHSWSWSFVHGHSWSWSLTLAVGARFLSNFTLILFVSFIGP